MTNLSNSVTHKKRPETSATFIASLMQIAGVTAIIIAIPFLLRASELNMLFSIISGGIGFILLGLGAIINLMVNNNNTLNQ